jgi:hypothetical protein
MEQALDPKLITLTPPNLYEAWEMVSSQLRMEMTRGVYESWVQPLKPLSFKEGVFRVSAANSYAVEWVESRLRSRITRLLESIYNRAVTVHFSVIVPGSTSAKSTPLANAHELSLFVVAEDPVQAGVATQEELSPQAELAAQENRAADSPRSDVGEQESFEEPGGAGEAVQPVGKPKTRGAKKARPDTAQPAADGGSPRKIQLQRAYGTERARIIQPERGMFLTMYFFNNWLPLLGHSAATTVLAARSMCYWNPMTGELRNLVETDMAEIARRAAVSVRTVKDVLSNELVKRYFLRYKVRRLMTPNGVRTAGILLQVRMDDPLTPEDQDQHHLPEDEHWFSADFDDAELL